MVRTLYLHSPASQAPLLLPPVPLHIALQPGHTVVESLQSAGVSLGIRYKQGMGQYLGWFTIHLFDCYLLPLITDQLLELLFI